MEKPISLFSGNFKRSAEHSFVVATSETGLCSRTWLLLPTKRFL